MHLWNFQFFFAMLIDRLKYLHLRNSHPIEAEIFAHSKPICMNPTNAPTPLFLKYILGRPDGGRPFPMQLNHLIW